jgi:hypothetical protein
LGGREGGREGGRDGGRIDSFISYECLVCEEEDTCTSYEEEDTCMSMHVPFHTNTISFFFFLAPAIPMPISFCCFPILMPSDSFFWRQLQRAEKNREALRSQESGGPVEVEVCSNVVFFCY